MSASSHDTSTDGEETPPAEAGDETNEQIREQRLDPDNRPEGAEIDNTHRTFDAEAGMFTDNPDYPPAEKPFPPLGEASESGGGDDAGDRGDGDDGEPGRHRSE